MEQERNFMKFNLHTHTVRCNHAVGSEREYVEQAIKAGVKVLGFADHTPQIYGNSHHSGMRMNIRDAEGYVNVVNSLKEEYKDDITILLGFEVEYYPDCFERLCVALDRFDYDYFILAQHFTNNEYDGKYVGGTCNAEHLELYANAICKALKLDCFTYVAHPDLPPFMGDMNFYREQMTRVCLAAKEKNVPLEINLLGLATGRIYPRREFWKIAKEVGNKAVIGLDAHSPLDFQRTGTYLKAMEFIKEMGLDLVTDSITLKSPKCDKKLVID